MCQGGVLGQPSYSQMFEGFQLQFVCCRPLRLKSNVAVAVAASVGVAVDARCFRFISFYGFPCAEE